MGAPGHCIGGSEAAEAARVEDRWGAKLQASNIQAPEKFQPPSISLPGRRTGGWHPNFWFSKIVIFPCKPANLTND